MSCPKNSPWDKTSRFVGIPGLVLVVLGAYILLKSSFPAFFVWLAAIIIFAYPLRFLVCARCPYYGQDCFTGMGKLVTLMFKRQEGRSMRPGLWLDVVFISIIFIIPLPFSYRNFGLIMTIVWIALFLAMFATTTRIGCSVCPFTFCPIGKTGRAFWKLLGR